MNVSTYKGSSRREEVRNRVPATGGDIPSGPGRVELLVFYCRGGLLATEPREHNETEDCEKEQSRLSHDA